MSDSSDPDLLSTWKDIAAFLNTSVRTAQRLERALGLARQPLAR